VESILLRVCSDAGVRDLGGDPNALLACLDEDHAAAAEPYLRGKMRSRRGKPDAAGGAAAFVGGGGTDDEDSEDGSDEDDAGNLKGFVVADDDDILMDTDAEESRSESDTDGWRRRHRRNLTRLRKGGNSRRGRKERTQEDVTESEPVIKPKHGSKRRGRGESESSVQSESDATGSSSDGRMRSSHKGTRVGAGGSSSSSGSGGSTRKSKNNRKLGRKRPRPPLSSETTDSTDGVKIVSVRPSAHQALMKKPRRQAGIEDTDRGGNAENSEAEPGVRKLKRYTSGSGGKNRLVVASDSD
jgi:hypothetical protein